RALDVLPFGSGVVEALAAQRRIRGKQVAVAEAAAIGENLLAPVVPDHVEVIRVLVRTGVKSRAEGQVATVRQGAGSVGLRRPHESVAAIEVCRELLGGTLPLRAVREQVLR